MVRVAGVLVLDTHCFLAGFLFSLLRENTAICHLPFPLGLMGWAYIFPIAFGRSREGLSWKISTRELACHRSEDFWCWDARMKCAFARSEGNSLSLLLSYLSTWVTGFILCSDDFVYSVHITLQDFSSSSSSTPFACCPSNVTETRPISLPLYTHRKSRTPLLEPKHTRSS
jgi:hypothetical protein